MRQAAEATATAEFIQVTWYLHNIRSYSIQLISSRLSGCLPFVAALTFTLITTTALFQLQTHQYWAIQCMA